MAGNLLSDLDSLIAKIGELRNLVASLAERNRILEAENADLQRQTREALAQRDRSKLDCEYLAVSHRLADSPDSLADARRHLAGLIRNIDRCLEMLKE